MRAFDIRHGGTASDGRWLPGFTVVRLGGSTLTVLWRWVEWPPGMRVTWCGGDVVLRWGCLILCARSGL